MRGREGTGLFSPDELNHLQVCFDDIIQRRRLVRPSEEADAVARALIEAFDRGVRDQTELIRLADIIETRGPQY